MPTMPFDSWLPSVNTLCLLVALLLGACPPPAEGKLCPAGVKYWDEKRAKCRPCTLCSPGDFTLYPCEVYRDTICGPLTSVVELLVQNGDNSVGHNQPSSLDWSSDLVATHEDLKNLSSTASQPRALLATQGHVFVVALAMAVMLVCIIIMVAIGIHMKRRKRVVALIDNEEVLDRLSLHGGRFTLSGRLHPTDQMKYLVELDHNLAMDRILEQRQRSSNPGHPPNVYVDHVILVNTSQRDLT